MSKEYSELAHQHIQSS